MTLMETVEQELREARQELAQAEQGLAQGTEAARTRYARALHEADLAERRALRASREQSHREEWRSSTG
jgi:hypothetical protein